MATKTEVRTALTNDPESAIKIVQGLLALQKTVKRTTGDGDETVLLKKQGTQQLNRVFDALDELAL